MKLIKLFTFYFFVVFLSLTFATYAETLKFDLGVYEGEVKKDKAHGIGVFTFNDGSIYKGKFKRNKFQGEGIYTDVNGDEYKGKFKGGKLRIKIEKKIRRTIALKINKKPNTFMEMKGEGATLSKWFEAEVSPSGGYQLTKKGKRDKESAERSSGGTAGDNQGSSGGGC